MNYRLNYADTQSDSLVDARSRERELLRRSIHLMKEAQGSAGSARAAIEAIHFASRIWTVFLEDLSSRENALPGKVRADLISVGIWILRDLEAIRNGNISDFTDIIEVTEIIRDGLL